MKEKLSGRNYKQGVSKPETEERYSAALGLYRTTDLPVKAICKYTDTPFNAFRAYIRRNHRDLLFARYGIEISPAEAVATRLRNPVGQTAAAHAKYKDAIHACDDMAYIDYNVSQIAHIFHLNPSALGRQLHAHFPEILERREKERCRLGINDNIHRGVKLWCKEQYAEAVEHLRTTDDTIRQTAALYNLSCSGLREHLLYYHKELVEKRASRRRLVKSRKKRGALTGNGTLHIPSPTQVDKYREALHLYRTTAMTQKEIAVAAGVTVSGLRNYLRVWNRNLILERRGVECGNEDEIDLSKTKHYLKSTAFKYAAAIKRMKDTARSTAEVAREFSLNPETFRMYLREHEPELASALGMVRISGAKVVSARSVKKYMEAIRLYESTTESLKSIAERLDLQYKSVGGFIRRNRPEAIKEHNRLLAIEKERRHLQKQIDDIGLARKRKEEEKERIRKALKQTGNNRVEAAKLLGICKSTLYNKLKSYNLFNNSNTIKI